MKYGDIIRHYAQKQVREEIAAYSVSRWVGVYCQREGIKKDYFVRYKKGKIPLTISNEEDLDGIFNYLRKLKPRSVYATAAIYNRLAFRDDVKSISNIVAYSPVLDVDSKISYWRATIEVCREISILLEREGVRSFFIKWSGEGAHVHIHHDTFSEDIRRKIHPLDLAWSVAEYISRKISRKVQEIAKKYNVRELRVDNEIDPQRLFTAPLSLHKKLDVVCICIPVNELDNFDLSWTVPLKYKHHIYWKFFRKGEADTLGQKAYELCGGYPHRLRTKRRKFMPVDEAIRKYLGY